MTTEMKQMLALLLLGCVFVVHGGEKGAEKQDPCTQGIAAMRLFRRYPGCAGPNPYERLESRLHAISSNMTVHNMSNLFTDFCSTMFPRIKQCFQRNVRNCSLAHRNSLMRVVQQTGFVCEPNTNRIDPVIDHLLTKLTDADLAENETCNKLNLSIVYPLCTNRSVEAIGASRANMTNVIKGLSMEQLAPKVQTFMRTMIGCVVNQAHHHLSSCPQWRGQAIRGIRYFILPPTLGKNMSFTTAELDRLFHWQSGAQTRVNVEQDVEQDSLLNWFK